MSDGLREALERIRQAAADMVGHGHWDPEMTRGAHCNYCIVQRGSMQRINAEIAQLLAAPDAREAEPAMEQVGWFVQSSNPESYGGTAIRFREGDRPIEVTPEFVGRLDRAYRHVQPESSIPDRRET